jgi:predicted 2-oxoglutarate/Fe(II)-dependent dioxygenase YbiX
MPNQSYEQIKVLSTQFISEEDCEKLIEDFDLELTLVEQQQYRAVQIKRINIGDVPGLQDSILSANSYHFKFDIDKDKVDCFFARYEPGMHYQQLHMDCVAGDKQRKLTFDLFLNDDFEGGELQLLHDEVLAVKKGKLLAFPSFLPHKVTAVTSGVRYVIFGWFYGPNFI